LNDVLDIMESVRHSALKSGASVLETEREFPIGKSAPRTNKSSLMLILGNNVDLIIPGETIHLREDFTFGAIVDNLIDEGCRKVVFGTRFVDIPIINAYMNCALFLIDRDKIGNPVSESHRVNKVGFEKFLDFELDSSRFTWVNWTKALPNGFSVGVCLDLMYHNLRVDTRHFFVALGEDVTKLFEKGRIGDDFIRGTRSSDMDIFDNPRFDRDVEGNSGRDIA
jgi:hypothetical protein